MPQNVTDAAPGMYRLKPSNFWVNPDAMGLPLLVLFLDHYGFDALSWSPVTIVMEIRDDFSHEPLPDVFARLMAAISIFTGNHYFVSLPDFCRLSLALAGEDGDYLPDLDDCACAMTEALLIHPPEKDQTEVFSPEIRAFLGALLDEEGILNPPDILQIAIRDKQGLADRAGLDFADDPAMFEAVSDVQREKTEWINRVVHASLQRLLQQLRDLPVKTAKTEQIAQTLLDRLGKIAVDNPDPPS